MTPRATALLETATSSAALSRCLAFSTAPLGSSGSNDALPVAPSAPRVVLPAKWLKGNR
jgi:hypothetical protein